MDREIKKKEGNNMESTGYDKALKVLDEMSQVLELDKKPVETSRGKRILLVIGCIITFSVAGFGSWLMGIFVGSLVL